MKKLNILLSTVAVVALTGCNSPKTENTLADEPKHAKDSLTTHEETQMDSAAIAKAWETYSTPGDMHKWMAKSEGKWTAEMRFSMGPDEPLGPASNADVDIKMILDGHYQESIFKGKMMGMDFNGREIMAYDNVKKKFVSTFVDNTGTGIMYTEGTYDETSQAIHFTGSVADPLSGKQKEFRQEYKFTDDKNHVLTSYDKKNGKEYISMEIKFTRK